MKYLIALILTICVIIFVIIKLLSGGSDSTQNPVAPKTLASYADTDTTVRFTIDNPVQAGSEHNDVIITVGRDEANLTVTKGYQGEVVRSQSYGTSEASYANFLLALQLSGGYDQGNDKAEFRDERGYCGTNNRYIYEIIGGDGTVIQHYWSTSCGQKTFKGEISIVEQLFERQIPDFNDLTRDIDF